MLCTLQVALPLLFHTSLFTLSRHSRFRFTDRFTDIFYRPKHTVHLQSTALPLKRLSGHLLPGLRELRAAMRATWLPSILEPDYTWPCPMRTIIATTTPPTPRIPGAFERRVHGLLHTALSKFSRWYCAWLGVEWDVNIRQLPFGLLIKSTDRASIGEYAAMKMARAAGMPVPRVFTCGEHPNDPYNRNITILMTRLPGYDLFNSDETLDVENEEPWLFELKACIDAMRQWKSPYLQRVCSALGTSIRSTRVPGHAMGPFRTEEEMHDFLISAESAYGFRSTNEYEEAKAKANEIRQIAHRITFTHGDLKAHNILIDKDGHLSGFLDWESAGWLPEYWDFTTAMRFGKNAWWYQVAEWMGGRQYAKELDCDLALHALTVDSYVCF